MGKHFNIRNQTFQWTDSVARMMSLRVIRFVSLFYGLLCQNDSDSDSNCECSDIKLRDSRTNKMIGECLTAYRGRYCVMYPKTANALIRGNLTEKRVSTSPLWHAKRMRIFRMLSVFLLNKAFYIPYMSLNYEIPIL